MTNTNPRLWLENIWDDFISAHSLPREASRFIPGTLNIEIDARRVGELVLDPKALHELQDRKRDLILVADPVLRDLSRFIGNDGFVALCEEETGFTFETANVRLGKACPGFTAEAAAISNSIRHNQLVELKVQCNDTEVRTGSFSSVIYPIYDYRNKLQAILSMGSISREISEDLRAAVYMGASLIETRYQTRQVLRDYSNALLNSMPDYALLLDENGLVGDVNEHLLNFIGDDYKDYIIGRPAAELLSGCTLGKNTFDVHSRFSLRIMDRDFPCSLTHTRSITTPYGSREHLILFKAENLTSVKPIGQARSLYERASSFDRMIGKTPAMEEVKVLGKRVARSSFSVLIEGESGTGKELLAEAIHEESGRRGLFVPINCGAIPRELLQTELFGYEDGAFTGGLKGGRQGKLEAADGGTIFLDEIGEMPIDMQVSLLRFLQDRIVTRVGGYKTTKVDVRVIAATNRQLINEVKSNRFRQDLYYRINEIRIEMPPLRNRRPDIQLLIDGMLAEICEEHHFPISGIDNDAARYLISYDWPGNCRELQNVLKNALIRTKGDTITLGCIQAILSSQGMQDKKEDSLQDVEKQTIVDRLAEYQGNVSRTADSLMINRSTLYRKIKEYNIS